MPCQQAACWARCMRVSCQLRYACQPHPRRTPPAWAAAAASGRGTRLHSHLPTPPAQVRACVLHAHLCTVTCIQPVLVASVVQAAERQRCTCSTAQHPRAIFLSRPGPLPAHSKCTLPSLWWCSCTCSGTHPAAHRQRLAAHGQEGCRSRGLAQSRRSCCVQPLWQHKQQQQLVRRAVRAAAAGRERCRGAGGVDSDSGDRQRQGTQHR